MRIILKVKMDLEDAVRGAMTTTSGDKRAAQALAAAVAWGALACAPQARTRDPEPDPAPELAAAARATCDAPIASAIALEDGLVESVDVTDAVRAVDAGVDFDEVSFAGVADFQRAVVAYALGVHPADLPDTATVAELRAEGILGDVVVAAFVAGEGALDFAFLRQGLHRFYACARGLPLTLSDLRLAHPAAFDGAAVVIDDSQPKAGPRRLWSSPGLFIAETLDGDAVRETEVVFAGRDDGALDFAVYDEAGALSPASRFATRGGGTVQTASPYTCLVCHFDDDLSFSVVHPE